VNYAQGWFYSKGIPAAEFIRFADAYNNSSSGQVSTA
jgi:sensor c-di-GMP phosphodiesterase-like protein